MNDKLEKLNDIVKNAKKIVIAQADNPDGDSLASTLALEEIIHDMGKEPLLYCAIDMPQHLRHLKGWDRVEKDVPKQFDAVIIVDCSSRTLFEIADTNGQLSWLLAKPTIIIDHHDTPETLQATITYDALSAVSTGEAIYEIASMLSWPVSINAGSMIAVSILSDSLGLMTEQTTSRSIRIIAELVEKGVNLTELDDARKQTMRKSQELVRYKGTLLQRIEYANNTDIAMITIPWKEIETYSSQYNPSILVLDDMRLTEGTKIAIAFKQYNRGKITAKIRSNYGFPIAKDLAEHFGGGGHPYASGFKVNNKTIDDVKDECKKIIANLLDDMSIQ